jgi:serine protease
VASLSGSTTAATATLATHAAGSVTVRLTITDDQGLVSSVDQTLSVARPASSGGGGALAPWWALGLLLAGLGLGRRRP